VGATTKQNPSYDPVRAFFFSLLVVIVDLICLVITAYDDFVDGGWSRHPERSGSRCHMALETGVKAGNKEQGIGIKKSNFKRNPENKEHVCGTPGRLYTRHH
jgi:hypothetical protein